MKILILIIFIFISGLLLSGCIGEINGKNPEIQVIQSTTIRTGAAETADTPPQQPAVTSQKPQYDKFVSWLKTDSTNKHPYIKDPSKVYEEQYVCSQYTRDFLKNATGEGFDVYSVLLTGGEKGQNTWHIIAAIILDKDLYFVEPQNDNILKKEGLLKAYGYTYAYFGKQVHINRNDAELSEKVYYNSVIGLNGGNYLYLK